MTRRSERSAWFLNRGTQLAVDLLVLSVAYWLAFMFRFDWDLPYMYLKRVGFTWPYVVAFQHAVLTGFGVHRFVWRHTSLREVIRIGSALGSAGAVLVVVRLIAAVLVKQRVGVALYALVPVGVIAVDFVLAFLGVAGVRGLRRALAERQGRARRAVAVRQVPTLLIGAGDAGAQAARRWPPGPTSGSTPWGSSTTTPSSRGARSRGCESWGRPPTWPPWLTGPTPSRC